MGEAQELQKMAEDPELIVSVKFGRRHYQAFIGDHYRGYRARRDVPSFVAAVRWLQAQARRLYPDSKYVQELPGHFVSNRGTA